MATILKGGGGGDFEDFLEWPEHMGGCPEYRGGRPEYRGAEHKITSRVWLVKCQAKIILLLDLISHEYILLRHHFKRYFDIKETAPISSLSMY